jgi:hypothetical protein
VESAAIVEERGHPVPWRSLYVTARELLEEGDQIDELLNGVG